VFSFRLTGLLAQRMPARVRIAAGRPGGMYFAFTKSLQGELAKTASRPVDIVETSGSLENSRELSAGKVNLAWLQGGAIKDDRLRIVALGYYEYVHVIARRDRGWDSIQQLDGRRVSLGEAGSGSHITAEALLGYYHLNVKESDVDLRRFEADPAIDAAILTIGLDSSDMHRLLASGLYSLLELPEADNMPDRTLEVARIPRATYPEGIANPRGVETLRTPAFLVARESAPDRLVLSALEALYRLNHPLLIPRSTAATWTFLPWHPAARRFYAR